MKGLSHKRAMASSSSAVSFRRPATSCSKSWQRSLDFQEILFLHKHLNLTPHPPDHPIVVFHLLQRRVVHLLCSAAAASRCSYLELRNVSCAVLSRSNAGAPLCPRMVAMTAGASSNT